MFNVTISATGIAQLATAFQDTGPGGWRIDFTETGTMSCVLKQNLLAPGTAPSSSNLTNVAYYDSNGDLVSAGTAITASGYVTVDAVNADLWVVATITGGASSAYITRQISPTTGDEPAEGYLPANDPAFTGTLTGPDATFADDVGVGGDLAVTGNTTLTGTALTTGVHTFTAAPVFTAGTASQTVELTAGKALTTAAITGTGSYVKSASPTMTGTIGAASATFSGTVVTTGATTNTGGLNLATEPTINPAAGGMWQLATAGTDKACTDGTSYFVELNIPYNQTITGLAYQVGSVGGTDSVIAVLYDSTGAVVANSALAGATVGTAAQIQSVAFLSPYAAVSGRYFASVTFNGATAKFRTYPIPGSKFITGSEAETFGTVTAITPGTTFTADVGPLCYTY